MVKLVKKQDHIYSPGTQIYSEVFHEEINKHEENSSNFKFDFKYPHQFLDLNKFNKQPQDLIQNQQQQPPPPEFYNVSRFGTNDFIKVGGNSTNETLKASKEYNNQYNHTNNFNKSKMTKDTTKHIQNESTYNEFSENKFTNNVIYNNVNNFRNSDIMKQSDIMKNSEEQKAYNKSMKITDHAFSENIENSTYKKSKHTIDDKTYLITDQKELNTKTSELDIEFKPLANSTILTKPSLREPQKKTSEIKKEDEDDVDAQFTKYYENMIESKKKDEKNEKIMKHTTKPVIVKEIFTEAKSNAPLFNQNYQSKLEERKRISKSSERVINEAKKDITELVYKDFSNAEWSGKTEVYTSQKIVQNMENLEDQGKIEMKIIEDEDEDEPYNELEKNPMFKRLRIMEEQIERCMSPERLEREKQFNKKFEEYYKEKTSKSNLMKSRWHAKGKQHSEENLHTPTKPYMPKPQERLTDPRGVFFKKRYEECVSSSSVNGKREIKFNTGFNDSRKFWKEMEKNCPGNSIEYRTHFINLQKKFNQKSSEEKHENNIIIEPVAKCFSPYDNHVEQQMVKKERIPLQEVQEPLIIKKHIDYDRSKTPVGFYENKKVKLKVEIPNKALEKIQKFAKHEDRKLRSPVAECLEEIIVSNSSSRRSSKTGDTPSSEPLDDAVKRCDNTFRTITPNPTGSSADGRFTPMSPFYYEKLKESPVFMGIKVKVAEDGDSKRCSICGDEADCEDFEENGRVEENVLPELTEARVDRFPKE